jgi:hypothetical protein
LMEKHTDIKYNDYPSCMLTDIWGNFWIFGLPMGALIVALCFSLLRYGLISTAVPALFVTSLIFVNYFIIFEKEFFDWTIGWIKVVPAIIFLTILNPIKKMT